MTTDARVARRKLSLLELAQDLGNVSKACRIVGYIRATWTRLRVRARAVRRKWEAIYVSLAVISCHK